MMQEQVIKKCNINDLGIVDYEEAYKKQKDCVAEVLKSGRESLLVCEHPSVFTLGRLASKESTLATKEEISKRGIKIINIDRGGEITLHCPGQLILYPILNLNDYKRDLKFYLNKLEQVAIDFLKEFDILACRIPDRRGVWVGEEKIASIGIGVKKWISFHGMSININSDLTLFSMIRPCGMDIKMTSVNHIKNAVIDVSRAKDILVQIFCREFGFVY